MARENREANLTLELKVEEALELKVEEALELKVEEALELKVGEERWGIRTSQVRWASTDWVLKNDMRRY